MALETGFNESQPNEIRRQYHSFLNGSLVAVSAAMNGFVVGNMVGMSFMVKATSVLGTPNFTLSLQTAFEDVDATYTTVSAISQPNFAAINDEVWHVYTVNFANCMQYARFYITLNGGDGGDDLFYFKACGLYGSFTHAQDVTLEAGDIEIGAVEIKDATSDDRINVITQDAAFGTATKGIAVFGKYQATPTAYTDNDAAPILLDANGRIVLSSDIEIGAVELKNGASDDRALISDANTGRANTDHVLSVQQLAADGTVPPSGSLLTNAPFIKLTDATTNVDVLPLTSGTNSTGLLSVAGEIRDFDTTAADDPTASIGILASSSIGAVPILASGLGALMIDTDGIWSATNTDPDNVGLIVHANAAVPADSNQTVRTTGGVSSATITTANFFGIDTRSKLYGTSGTDEAALTAVTQDAAFGTASIGLPVFGKYEATPTTYTDGDAAPILLDANGRIVLSSDIEIGSVELKDAAADTRASIIAADTAAVAYYLATMPARYLAAAPTLTDTRTSPLLLDVSNQLKVVDSAVGSSVATPTTLTGGSKTVGISGTAEALGASLATKSIYIRAKSTNTVNVFVGDSLVDAVTNQQIILAANDSVTIDINNRNVVYIDVALAGEGVDYLCQS